MKKRIIITVIVSATVALFAASAFFFWKSRPTSLSSRVGRHIVLPNEKATIIPVTNAEALKKSQAFFTNANDGDVVLIFTKKVILYDPKADKIVEVAVIK